MFGLTPFSTPSVSFANSSSSVCPINGNETTHGASSATSSYQMSVTSQDQGQMDFAASLRAKYAREGQKGETPLDTCPRTQQASAGAMCLPASNQTDADLSLADEWLATAGADIEPPSAHPCFWDPRVTHEPVNSCGMDYVLPPGIQKVEITDFSSYGPLKFTDVTPLSFSGGVQQGSKVVVSHVDVLDFIQASDSGVTTLPTPEELKQDYVLQTMGVSGIEHTNPISSVQHTKRGGESHYKFGFDDLKGMSGAGLKSTIKYRLVHKDRAEEAKKNV